MYIYYTVYIYSLYIHKKYCMCLYIYLYVCVCLCVSVYQIEERKNAGGGRGEGRTEGRKGKIFLIDTVLISVPANESLYFFIMSLFYNPLCYLFSQP